MVARGGFVTDISWENHKLVTAKVFSRNGGKLILRTNEQVMVKGILIKSVKSTIGYTLSIQTEKDKDYEVVLMK